MVYGMRVFMFPEWILFNVERAKKKQKKFCLLNWSGAISKSKKQKYLFNWNWPQVVNVHIIKVDHNECAATELHFMIVVSNTKNFPLLKKQKKRRDIPMMIYNCSS